MQRTAKLIILAFLISGSVLAHPPRPSQLWRTLTAAVHPSIQAVWPPALDSSPYIRNMVDKVSSDSILRTIQDPQDFGTRYEYAHQLDQAAESLLERLRILGYRAESDRYATGLTDLYDLAHVEYDSLWAVSLSRQLLRSKDCGATG